MSAIMAATPTTPTTTFRLDAAPEEELISVEERSGGASLPSGRTTGADVVSSVRDNDERDGASAGENGAGSSSANDRFSEGTETGKLRASALGTSVVGALAVAVARSSVDGGTLSMSLSGAFSKSAG